ncbi:MAG TPA: DbpA RNA binding domain-containing protein, partial [Spirochaetota bacterium]|nr:DbpA RNA binding domain-containing protein [Spirochaetota bacterium]
TKKMVDELVSHLQARGYFADGLHGDMKQQQRNAVMTKFKGEIVDILIATDVAARGIDIDNIELVINYDIPQDEEYYVHRIGRTGRAGRSGKAVTLASGKEIRKIREIENYIRVKIKKIPVPTIDDVEEFKTTRFIDEIKGTINEGHLTKYINIIENFTDDEISTLDVAAALFKMAMKNTKSDEAVKENYNDDSDNYNGYRNSGDMARLFINIGKKQNISPKHIVGSIANETGMEGSLIGTIDIFDDFTFVEVPKEYADQVIDAMKNNFINGKKINIEVAKKKK